MPSNKSTSVVRKLIIGTVAFFATTTCTSSARAAQHFWAITELYSNNSGSLQFIEMFTSFGGQNVFTGFQFQVQVSGAGPTHTFNVPQVNLPGDTTNKFLLFGTAGVAAAGGPTPDYILPDNFLYTGGGSITFFGANSGPYTSLPLDGLMSRDFATGTNFPMNTATNYGLNGPVFTGTVNGVPEPTTMILTPIALGMFGVYRRLSRRNQKLNSSEAP